MNRILKINNIITKSQKLEILNLVSNNAEAISINIFDKNSKISDYLSAREKVKTEIYLSRIGEPEPRATHLIITVDNLNKIVGYILYHKVVNQPNDIAIINTIVSSNCRNKGVLRKMMDILKTDYKSISLSCFPKLVNLYEKLGFKIACQWQTQIGMYFGYQDEGSIITVDDESLNSNETIQKEFKKFQTKHNDWNNIINQLNLDNSKAIEVAEKYTK